MKSPNFMMVLFLNALFSFLGFFLHMLLILVCISIIGAVEHKLFVGSLNRQATEKEIEEVGDSFYILLTKNSALCSSTTCAGCLFILHYTFFCRVFNHFLKFTYLQIFSPYGCIEDVYIMRDESKQSRGLFIYIFL